MAIDGVDDAGLPGSPAGPETVGNHLATAGTDARSRQDRPEPRDAAEDPGTGSARTGSARTETATGDLRQRQLAEHARYRGVVEAVDQAAARDAWAIAVPALRAAWEEHKHKYPERMEVPPETQPDGSWAAGGHRRLDPEQNAEASNCSADLRDEADRVIRPAMKRVEAADPERSLAGLEHMLKGEDRLKEKIADELAAKPGKTLKESLSEIADAVRFTLCYPSERYAEGVGKDVDRLKAEGFELIKLKNLWADEQYKGINSQWRRPDSGMRVEMQFHTLESLEAKELTHQAYERIRGSEASPAERRELKDFQRHVNGLLVTPPGTADIKDFPERSNG